MHENWSIKKFDKLFENYDEIAVEIIRKNNGQFVSSVPDSIRMEITDLKLKGWSYSKIAEKLKTTKSAVSGLVMRHRL